MPTGDEKDSRAGARAGREERRASQDLSGSSEAEDSGLGAAEASADARGPYAEPEPREPSSRGVRRLLAERLLAGLSESGDVLRRGQGLVSDVAQTTKEEVRRIAAAELRGLVEELDLSELIQEVVVGMVVEIKGEVRFRRSDDGVVPEIHNSKTTVRRRGDSEDEAHPASGGASKAERAGNRGDSSGAESDYLK